MKKYDLYLFDFDGTLLNTMDALEFVFQVSYGHIGMEFKHEDTIEFSRIPLNVGFEKMHAKEEDWPEFCKYIDKSLDFEEALERNHPYPETYEFIEYLRKNHIRAGIVTSNNVHHVQEVLEHLNIPIDTFEIYIGNKECEFFKPHPDPIFKALLQYERAHEKDKIVYVGDGMNDTLSANAAGVDAILIDRVNAFPDSDKYTRISSLMELFK